jgi:hypothetical protein
MLQKKRLAICQVHGSILPRSITRGHSLMVKLQPSKLAMRVRFSLPALSLEINDLCKVETFSMDFPNTFSLELPVCPIRSIHALAAPGYQRDRCNFIR